MDNNVAGKMPEGAGVTGAPVVEAPVGGGMVAEPVKKKSRTGLIVGLVVGGIALIGIATAVILLVILGNRPDYAGAQEIVAQMMERREVTSDGIDMGAIMDGSGDEETISEAKATVAETKSAIAELKNRTKELGESTALKDEVVKAKYDEFMAVSDIVLPKLEKLALAGEVFVDFAQEFAANDIANIIAGKDMDGLNNLSEEKLREIFAPLKSVGLPELTRFAEDSEEMYVKLYNFFKRFGDVMSGGASLSESEAAEAQEIYLELAQIAEAYEEEWMEDDAVDMGERLLGLSQDEVSEYFEKLEGLQREIEDKV